MLIPPNEDILALAERWLKLLSDLGWAQATLSAYSSPQLPGMPFPAASATLQLPLSAIRLWYDFLMYLDLCTVNPLPCSGAPGMLSAGRGLLPRLVKLPHIPDDAQWQSFLFYATASPLRYHLMLALTYYYGALRRSEVTSLSIEDFDFAHRLIRIRAESTKSRIE